jgi:nicotinamidase-related amidase
MTDKKKILVVIDMQNDFIDGPLGTPEARGIVDKVCEKIRDGEWDAILVTQDTHDKDYLSTQEGRKLPVEHCIENTKGWLINNEIFGELLKLDYVEYFKKDTFGDRYLHFEIFQNAYELDPAFDDKDVNLTLVGVCTDICVISNALLLKAHYPEMNIMVDAACCAGTSPEKHRMALEVMKSCQIDILEEE